MIKTSLASDSPLPAVGELFENVLRASLLGGCAIIAVLVLRRLLKRSLSPAARCVLWLPVAALLVSPRLPDLGWGTGHETLPLRVATKSQTPTKQDEIVVRTDSPVFLLPAESKATDSVRSLRLFPIATWVWVFGSALVMAFWLLNYLLLCIRISRSKQPVPEQLANLVTLCSKLIGLRKPPLLKVTSAVSTPALMGLFRPTIVVPPALDEALDAHQLRMVILHESGHVKRHDLIFHWFALALLALHWFNPLCWLAAWLFRADREAACDATVLNACKEDSRALYGHTLLILQEGLSSRLQFRPLVGVLGSADMLRERIVEIAHFGRSSRWVGVSAVIGMTFMSLGLAVFAAEPAKPKTPAPASPEATADKGLETRVYKLPPSFFKPSGAEANSDQIEPKSWLADQGVDFPEGASAVYSKTSSQLVMRNTVKNLNVADKLIDLQLVELEKSRRQVYITTKLVVFDEKEIGKAFAMVPDQNNLTPATPKADPLSLIGALTDPQFQVVMRALSQRRLEALLVLPSVATRSRQNASVEVVREFQFPTEYEPGANGADAKPVAFEKRDIGFKMGVLPAISGGGTTVELSLSPEITTFMEMKDFGKGVRQPVFSSNSITTSVVINDGDTIELAGEMPISNFLLDPKAKDITAPPAKRYPVLLFVTARLIDPSGQHLNKPKETSTAKAPAAQPQNKP